MIAKQFKKCRRKHLTLRTKCLSMIVLGLFLFGSSGYSQVKPRLPQKPQPQSMTVQAVAYDNVPSSYERVGTTDLCYQQKGYSIDIKGYYAGSWYRSTYSDNGYRVAMSITQTPKPITDEDISGNYTVSSWRGYERYWNGESFVTEEYVGNDFYNATIQEKDDGNVILSNFTFYGGSINGSIDRENRTITFPAQEFYMTEWSYNAWFCKQTDTLNKYPYADFATEEVVATYDEDFNITMDGWCLIIPFGTESYLCADNTLSMTLNQPTDEGTYLTNCNNGETYNGVLFSSYVEQQGELARMCYSLTNTNDVSVTVSLGTHADVMIGDNDRAPIERRKDQSENTYGLTMKNGNGAELCVLFGAGLAGVTKVDDFWFGYYYTNWDPYQMVGKYEPRDNWMQENGSYDSGMGWCWKNRTIPAGATVVFSYLIGVGDVNLEPNSSFEVTPDDPDGWNDLSRPHKLTLNGMYESPAGIDGMIEYAVEDSEEWTALTQMLASGEGFEEELVATFDPEKETHTIRFRTVDAVGNTTLLTPIVYKDVYYHEITGIEDKIYTYGDSIYQELDNLICDLDPEEIILNEYQNNVNVGTATFMAQGVFPKTIGRRTYSFQISPRELEGELLLPQNYFVYYDEDAFLPTYEFSCEKLNDLILDVDYNVTYKNNVYPGEGTVEVTGIGNYTGTLQAIFTIDKAQVTLFFYDILMGTL